MCKFLGRHNTIDGANVQFEIEDHANTAREIYQSGQLLYSAVK
jgi:hypothetical protein